ncbi:MAG: response regulator transcription factor [Chloroflexi bacterium]|nr:response regulator transcription factor [Chloroflexota bacterium]
MKYVGTNLRARGFEVLTAADGTEGLKMAEENLVDLVLLDLMMPGPDGFEVCQKIRQTSDVPIIILSARGQERDKVRALNLGADDYLTKPFGVEELLARVRAALRRSQRGGAGPLPAVQGKELTIDFASRRVALRGEQVKLTPTEYSILALLARNTGKVLTHRTILQTVWGPEYGEEHDYLWVYMRRLRNKIEPDVDNPRYLVTEPGVGYRFQLDE